MLYQLKFANGTNDTVRANKAFVSKRGRDIELLFADVKPQGTGTVVKRIMIDCDAVEELLGELRSIVEPDISAQPGTPR